MKLVLPFPPSVNHYYKHIRKRVILSDRGLAYKAEVKARVLEQLGLVKPMTHRIIMTTTLFPPTRTDRDIDNFLKALCDALEKSQVFENDSQIDVHHVYRGPVIKFGSCEVQLKEIKGNMFDENHLNAIREEGF